MGTRVENGEGLEFEMQTARGEEIRQRLASLKVLVVDDNTFMRKLVRDLLSNIGVRHVTEAADGADAPRCWIGDRGRACA